MPVQRWTTRARTSVDRVEGDVARDVRVRALLCGGCNPLRGKMKRVLASLAIVSALASLTGCGADSKSGLTCEEYGELPGTERTAEVIDLVEAQGLNPTSSASALVALQQDVHNFCGIAGIAIEAKAATRNLDRPIGEGVDWEQYGA